MREFLGFWLQCCQTAWSGSISFANSWGPIVGAAFIYGILWMNGLSFHIPSDILGIIVGTAACLGTAWTVIFVGRLLFIAPYRVFQRERIEKESFHNQASVLAQKFSPKLHCEFDVTIPGCRESTTEDLFVMRTGQVLERIPAIYFRVKISCIGALPVPGCSGRLRAIKGPANIFNSQALELPFAPATQLDAYSKTVWPEVPVFLDVFTATSKNVLKVNAVILPNSFPADFFAEVGDYEFDVAVLVPNGITQFIKLRAQWNRDWQTIKAAHV